MAVGTQPGEVKNEIGILRFWGRVNVDIRNDVQRIRFLQDDDEIAIGINLVKDRWHDCCRETMSSLYIVYDEDYRL